MRPPSPGSGEARAPRRGPRLARALAAFGLVAGASCVAPLAGPGAAGEGLYLTWNECARAAAARHDLRSPCDQETGGQALYAAFTVPHAIDSVVAVEVEIATQVAGGALPEWWQYQPEGCRFRSLVASAAFVAEIECADFWQERATPSQLPAYFVGEPRGRPGQARMRAAFALLPEHALRLEPGNLYYAARITFRNALTSMCPGCSAPACLVLNSIVIGRLPGAPGGDLVLTAAGPDLANRSSWQGSGADCEAVPVARLRWGALKSLFR